MDRDVDCCVLGRAPRSMTQTHTLCRATGQDRDRIERFGTSLLKSKNPLKITLFILYQEKNRGDRGGVFIAVHDMMTHTN